MSDTAPKPAKPLCFVVGPIGPAGSDIRKHADMILHAILKDVLEKDNLGYKVKRADEDPRPGMIGDRVIHDILNADLVVADLTDLNPNAFYELGIRHLAERPTIHIAKEGTQLPFDNLGHDTIFVDVASWQSIIAARTRIFDAATSIKDTSFRASNPITQAKASIALRESADPKDQVLSDLQDRIKTLEQSMVLPVPRKTIPRQASLNIEIVEIICKEAAKNLSAGRTIDDVITRLRDIAMVNGYDYSIKGIVDGHLSFNILDISVMMRLDGSNWELGPHF